MRCTDLFETSDVDHYHDFARCVHALNIRGWQPSRTPDEYRNPEYPEYAVDLDVTSDKGPYTVLFRGKKRPGTLTVPPIAQHLALRDRLI